jgi:hypothetical protein
MRFFRDCGVTDFMPLQKQITKKSLLLEAPLSCSSRLFRPCKIQGEAIQPLN